MTQDPPKPFTTDLCSGPQSVLWRFFADKPVPWEGLCIIHDLAYYFGGPLWMKVVADLELALGIAKRGYPVWALLTLAGVSIWGLPWLPYPSFRRINGKWKIAFNEVRWGYGYKYPQYQAILINEEL